MAGRKVAPREAFSRRPRTAGYFCTVRTADNRVSSVLGQYRLQLADRYEEGEVRAIVRSVFADRLGWDMAQFDLRRGEALSESELLKVYMPLKRLRAGEPLQYVLGTVEFHGLQLRIGPGVLIPRPETEELVDRIIRTGKVPGTIVDIGTGSGCIALALKKAFPSAHVLGIDVSEAALVQARENARTNGLEVEWVRADVLSLDRVPVSSADLIVSNPPYVPLSDANDMSEHVLAHEPHVALFVADDEPLLFYRTIATLAYQQLAPGGDLWFEGHHRYTPAVGDLLKSMSFADVEVLPDLTGHHRFIHAVR